MRTGRPDGRRPYRGRAACTLGRIPARLYLRTIPVLLHWTACWAMPRFLRWINGGDPVPVNDRVLRFLGDHN